MMMAREELKTARDWLDLAVKACAVIAIVAYLARRDAEITAATDAVSELRHVATDLARGMAVSTTRLDALDSRVDLLER